MAYASTLQINRTYVPAKINLWNRVKTAVRDYFNIEKRPDTLSRENVLDALYSGLEGRINKLDLKDVNPTEWHEKFEKNPDYFNEFLENNNGAMFEDGNRIYEITNSGINPTEYNNFSQVPSTWGPNGPRIFSIGALLLLLLGIGVACGPQTQETRVKPTDTLQKPSETPNATVSPTISATPTATYTPTATFTPAITATPQNLESIFRYYCMPSGAAGGPGDMPNGAIQPVFDVEGGFYRLALPNNGFSACQYAISNLPPGQYTLKVYAGQSEQPLFTRPLVNAGKYHYANFGNTSLPELYLTNPSSFRNILFGLQIVDANGGVIREDNLFVDNPFFKTPTPTRQPPTITPDPTETFTPGPENDPGTGTNG